MDESYRFDPRDGNRGWLSEYDRTKWLAHYEVAEPMMRAGLPLVIVQPGLVYGPGDVGTSSILLHRYLRRQLPAAPRKAALCWGHVDDTARGHVLAMAKGRVGESYIIAGPPHTIVDALAIAERITGIPAPRLLAPPAAMRLGSALMSVVERVISLPEAYASESLRVTAGVTYLGSSEKARRELDFTARPLEAGLRETLEDELQRLRGG